MSTLLEGMTRAYLAGVAGAFEAESLPRIPSRTLRGALISSFEQGRDGKNHRVRMHLPYYWAYYLHEGRDSITFPPGKYMIFFPDIKDDPRVDGGLDYPKTKADRRHLTRGEFKYFTTINNERPGNPIMVVAGHVKRAIGDPFFKDASQHLYDSGLLNDLAAELLGSYLSSPEIPRGRGRVVVSL